MICAVCSLPVEGDDAHFPHDEDCPRVDCTCDLVVHAACCRDCKENADV